MPKIFVSTVPFGEVDPKPVESLDQTGWSYTVNPIGRKLTGEEVASFAMDCDGIIAGTEDLRPLIRESEKLKVISRVGIGLDSVPLKECQRKGITVTYTPDAVTKAVSELTVGIMISLTRHVNFADMNIRQGNWKRKQGKRIGKSVIGIIGFGRIGTDTVRLLSSFAPEQILINDIVDKSREVDRITQDYGLKIRQVEKEEIYRKSDIVSLHVPLSPATANLINANVLKQFNKNAWLLNLARGGIVNEDALYIALKNDQIAGAAIDCFIQEPYEGPLAKLDNILLTQHMGSCSFDCRAGMEIEATEDIIRFFKGEVLKNKVPEEEYGYQGKF